MSARPPHATPSREADAYADRIALQLDHLALLDQFTRRADHGAPIKGERLA